MRQIGSFFASAVVAVLCATAPASAAEILITQFDFSGYTDMATNLAAKGHNVTVVDVRTPGTLATTLGAGNFDQVFLFDLTSSSYLNAADTAALSSFASTHKGLVIDTRSYGYFFQGNQASEVALLQNVAATFELTGGGVWVGTDHAPDWTRNANPFLNQHGINPVTGLFSNPVNFADPASVLLAGVTPTDLWGGGQSVGQAPLGLQPNGTNMFLHFGHIRQDGSIIPYISASFPLQGPDPIPEPSSLIIFSVIGIGAAGGFVWRRKKKVN